MAGNAKTNGFLSSIAGAAMAFGAAVGPAHAQEAVPAAQPGESTLWTPELRALRAAEDNASAYSKECFERGEKCVGILLHIGDDLVARRDQIAAAQDLPVEAVEAWMVQKLEDHYASLFAEYGVDVKLFPSPSEGTASGVAYYTDNIIFENSAGRADLNLKMAEEEVPNVVRSLEVIRELAAGNDIAPQPAAGE